MTETYGLQCFELDLEPTWAFVRDEVAADRYAGEGEVIRDAVRCLAELREAMGVSKLDALRTALAPGLADLAAGRFVEGGIMDVAGRFHCDSGAFE